MEMEKSTMQRWPLAQYADAVTAKGVGVKNAVVYKDHTEKHKPSEFGLPTYESQVGRATTGALDMPAKAMEILRDVEGADFVSRSNPVQPGSIGFVSCEIDGKEFEGTGSFRLTDGQLQIDVSCDEGKMDMKNAVDLPTCKCCSGSGGSTPSLVQFHHSTEATAFIVDLSEARCTMSTVVTTRYAMGTLEEGQGAWCDQCCSCKCPCQPCLECLKNCCEGFSCCTKMKLPELLSLDWVTPTAGEIEVEGTAGTYTATQYTTIVIEACYPKTPWNIGDHGSPVRRFEFVSKEPDQTTLKRAMQELNKGIPVEWHNGGSSRSGGKNDGGIGDLSGGTMSCFSKLPCFVFCGDKKGQKKRTL